MTNTQRCSWSDLLASECAHCTGDREATYLPPLEPPAADAGDTADQPAVPRPAPQRTHLPALTGGRGDLHDMFDELVRGHSHAEPRAVRRGETTYTENHVTQVPALVHQLLAQTGSTSGSKSESGSTAVSKPAARIECLDTLMLIDTEAGVWIDQLGGDIPDDATDPDRPGRPIVGSGTLARLRLLHGLYPSAAHCGRDHARRDPETRRPVCCDRHLIEHAVYRWWQQARIITGWDTPAYRPFNTCPVCDVRGSLRVRADALAVEAAFCVECRTVWDNRDIGLLAQHIRHENLDEDDGHQGEGDHQHQDGAA